MHHPFGIAGLIVNMTALVLLWVNTPKVQEYTTDKDWSPDGGFFSEVPASADGRKHHIRRFHIRRDGFRLPFALLFLGFLLQLLDLLVA